MEPLRLECLVIESGQLLNLLRDLTKRGDLDHPAIPDDARIHAVSVDWVGDIHLVLESRLYPTRNPGSAVLRRRKDLRVSEADKSKA